MASMAMGLWNHLSQGGQAAAPMSAPAAQAAGESGDSGAGSATIGANDFLTLLVTEMENQDPTANTDPNEYINQLVQVNSLEQLISINQTLSSAAGNSAGGSAVAGSSPTQAISAPGAATEGASPQTSVVGAIHSALSSGAIQTAPGNLSIPAAKPSAISVAKSLGGHQHSN